MTDELKLIVNTIEYPMPETFTLGELADMEKITGQGYDMAQGGVLATLALAFVAMKRVDSRVTLNDIRALTGDEFEIKGADDAVPPSPGASNANEHSSNATSKPASADQSDETPVPIGAES